MTGTLACVECRLPGALDSEVLVLTCGCGGSLRFVPGHTPTVVDSITVPGAPALVPDLIDRFRSGDRVVVEDAIAGYHWDAAAARSDVEERLQLFVASCGGSLAGLEYAIKQMESIRRKVHARLRDGSALDPGSAITDALRFTAIFATDLYADSAQEVIWRLQDGEQEVIDEENSWAPGDSYSGLQYIMQTPTGSLYEFQIHTPESFKLKNGMSHAAYEEYRAPMTTEARRHELAAQMSAEWSKIPIPEEVLGFGGPDAYRRYDA